MGKEKIKDGASFIGSIKNWRGHKNFSKEITNIKSSQRIADFNLMEFQSSIRRIRSDIKHLRNFARVNLKRLFDLYNKQNRELVELRKELEELKDELEELKSRKD